nr:glutaredoxin family protein [Oceanobacter mangrovi]
MFGTEGCHLCEDAEAMLVTASGLINIEVWQQDIAEDEQLVAAYGLKIPVLKHDSDGEELNWPFDMQRLLDWLSSHQSGNKELK